MAQHKPDCVCPPCREVRGKALAEEYTEGLIYLHEHLKKGLTAYDALAKQADKEFASDLTLAEFSLLDPNREWRYYFTRSPENNKAQYDRRESAAISPLDAILAKRRQQAENFKP